MKFRHQRDTFGLTDVFAAGLTVFRVQRLEATAAIGPTILHDVPLTTQDGLAFKAGKVLHMPVTTLCLCALVRKNYLWGNLHQWMNSIHNITDLVSCTEQYVWILKKLNSPHHRRNSVALAIQHDAVHNGPSHPGRSKWDQPGVHCRWNMWSTMDANTD